MAYGNFFLPAPAVVLLKRIQTIQLQNPICPITKLLNDLQYCYIDLPGSGSATLQRRKKSCAKSKLKVLTMIFIIIIIFSSHICWERYKQAGPEAYIGRSVSPLCTFLSWYLYSHNIPIAKVVWSLTFYSVYSKTNQHFEFGQFFT